MDAGRSGEFPVARGLCRGRHAYRLAEGRPAAGAGPDRRHRVLRSGGHGTDRAGAVADCPHAAHAEPVLPRHRRGDGVRNERRCAPRRAIVGRPPRKRRADDPGHRGRGGWHVDVEHRAQPGLGFGEVAPPVRFRTRCGRQLRERHPAHPSGRPRDGGARGAARVGGPGRLRWRIPRGVAGRHPAMAGVPGPDLSGRGRKAGADGGRDD